MEQKLEVELNAAHTVAREVMKRLHEKYGSLNIWNLETRVALRQQNVRLDVNIQTGYSWEFRRYLNGVSTGEQVAELTDALVEEIERKLGLKAELEKRKGKV